jgi:hypothetical protein
MPTIRGVRFRLSHLLNAAATKLFVPPGGRTYLDIGLVQLGTTAPRALVVYVAHVIPYFLEGNLDKAPMLNEHSMYWETVEMVKQLNARGYVVDFYDVTSIDPIDWEKYSVAFVQNPRLIECPTNLSIKKVFYCTENYWAFQNLAELVRLRAFHQRTGIWVAPERQTRISFSDEYADIITSFGTYFQQQLYHPRPLKHLLNISVAQQPEHVIKNVAAARTNFIWLGSGGAILKGADIAIEAFLRIPDANLYLAGNLEKESRLWQWIKPLLDKHSNLHYLGWVDVASAKFAKIANSCIGQIYPSASEGGPGAVAQLLHFGLIPIVTQSAAVRGAHLGVEIISEEPNEIITQLVKAVQEMTQKSDQELQKQSIACQHFAAQYHTRPAYAASFASLLDQLAL